MVKCSNLLKIFNMSHIFQCSFYTTNSLYVLHIFPKTRVYDNSNGMRNIFLLLTQAAQFDFLKCTHFCKPFKLVMIQKSSKINQIKFKCLMISARRAGTFAPS